MCLTTLTITREMLIENWEEEEETEEEDRLPYFKLGQSCLPSTISISSGLQYFFLSAHEDSISRQTLILGLKLKTFDGSSNCTTFELMINVNF